MLIKNFVFDEKKFFVRIAANAGKQKAKTCFKIYL